MCCSTQLLRAVMAHMGISFDTDLASSVLLQEANVRRPNVALPERQGALGIRRGAKKSAGGMHPGKKMPYNSHALAAACIVFWEGKTPRHPQPARPERSVVWQEGARMHSVCAAAATAAEGMKGCNICTMRLAAC